MLQKKLRPYLYLVTKSQHHRVHVCTSSDSNTSQVFRQTDLNPSLETKVCHEKAV